VWNIARGLLREEEESMRWNICLSITLPTTNLTRTSQCYSRNAGLETSVITDAQRQQIPFDIQQYLACEMWYYKSRCVYVCPGRLPTKS